MLQLLAQALAQFISIYTVLLIIRILLTWFPNIDWSNPLLSALSQITDPYLNLFRSIIPAIGGIDFSPILAFIVLQFLSQALARVAYIAYNSGGSFMTYSSF
ncbi:MAG: YggT family protein [Cyanobacteria bacterium P01_G01_bin.38]